MDQKNLMAIGNPLKIKMRLLTDMFKKSSINDKLPLVTPSLLCLIKPSKK